MLAQDTGGMDYALGRALDMYWNDRAALHKLQETCMSQARPPPCAPNPNTITP